MARRPRRLSAIARAATTNLRLLTASALPAALHQVLPPAWHNCTAPVSWSPGKDGHPSEAWLSALWAKLQVSRLPGRHQHTEDANDPCTEQKRLTAAHAPPTEIETLICAVRLQS